MESYLHPARQKSDHNPAYDDHHNKQAVVLRLS